MFNILLQIMEDGRLTDSQGRNVDFKNAVLVMTSNVGAQKIVEGLLGRFGEGLARRTLHAMARFRAALLGHGLDLPGGLA